MFERLRYILHPLAARISVRQGVCAVLFAALLMTGCAKDGAEEPPTPVGRTLLVYMAGDNNLSANGYNNLQSITATMQGYTGDARTVVYIDTPGENPRLIEATASGQRELYRWSSPQNSASGATLAEVIALTHRLAPASRYGLVLWSHGVGWLPSSATGYLVARSLGRNADPWPATKWFGQDVTSSPMGYIDTEDLAAAIPSGVFDYILFDACYMGSVEVLYALRDKCDWIISSPTEVIAEGFPYGDILPQLLLRTPDLESVCRRYYNYYVRHPNATSRSATVSLVRTSQLEALAAATQRLYTAALAADPNVFTEFDISSVQRLDRYRRPFIFDLASIIRRLKEKGAVSQTDVEHWLVQLARTVVYEAHTDAFFDLILTECSGLSSFIPVAAYSDLSGYYSTLSWSRQTIRQNLYD